MPLDFLCCECDVHLKCKQFFDKEQFKCRYCDVVRKYSNGGRTSLIQHSDSAKHKKIADGKKGRVTGQPRVGVGFLITFLFWLFH